MSNPSKRKCIRPANTILDLNDHVLREIFRNLDASDLCAVADVRSTLKYNAQAEFSLRYKFLSFSTAAESELHVRQLASALRNFGSSIRKICISLTSALRNQSPRVLELMIEYCGESLNDLSLNYVDFSASMVLEMRTLLSRLQTLRLYRCTFQTKSLASKMFSFCSELRTLKLIHVRCPGLRVTMPKLKSFRLTSATAKSIEPFLAVNPQLKEIYIYECSRITSEIIPIIAKCTPRIEEFELVDYKVNDNASSFVENAKHLKRLTKLKSLEIDCGGESFSPVLKELAAAQIPLECLELLENRPDAEFVNELSKWKQLKRLGLRYNICLYDVLAIISNLSELTELVIDSDLILVNDLVEIVRSAPKLQELQYELKYDPNPTCHVGLFMEIRDVVVKREENRHLDLFYSDDSQKLNVPERLLRANKDVIKIGEAE